MKRSNGLLSTYKYGHFQVLLNEFPMFLSTSFDVLKFACTLFWWLTY